MRSSVSHFVLLSALCFCIGGLVFAGSTTPPAGPVVGTFKTLDEVEPRIPIGPATTPGDANSLYRVDTPGSYYLTGNVTGVSGDHGIEIASDNVSIDLMGYTLQGIAGSLTGIANDGVGRSNITIRNGVVAGWGNDGIDLVDSGVFSESTLIEGVHASANGVYGIRSGRSAVVRDCTAESNGNIGIVADSYSTVERCSARLNGSTGISAQTSCTVRGCSASENSGGGITASTGSVVSECVSYNNTGDGFGTGSGVTITGCSAYFNDGDGIDLGSSCTVINCSSYLNAVDGIEASGDCLILGNTVDSNSGAGIQVVSFDCRIEGNSVTDSPIGIDVNFSGNLIIRNSASGNTTNYSIAANNKVGVIVSAPNSLAISGSTGGAGVGTTNPWANFSY